MKLTLIFLAIFSLSVHAQDYSELKNYSEIKQQLKTHHESLKSLSSEFQETIYSSMFNTPVKNDGSLFYKKNDKVRWENGKQIILIDGKSIQLSEDGKEVSSPASKMMVKKIQSLMLGMLSGDFLNEKEFSIRYFSNSSNYKLELIPKSDRLKKYIGSIELIFNQKSLLLHEMSLIEDQTEKIVYNFTNIKANESISDSKFNTF